MENLPQQGSSAAFTGGIAAALVILLGLFVVTQGPLKSARPISAPSTSDFALTDEKVPARLWQDPFEVVQEHLPQMSSGLGTLNEALGQYARNLAEQADGGTETKAAGIERGEESPAQQNDAVEERPGGEINQARNQLRDAFTKHCDKYDTITVMASMVFGGRYNEIKEGRIRARYATLTALANQSFVPVDSQHIGYFQTQLKFDNKPQFVPYEWLESVADPDEKSAEQRDAILLLWVIDDLFFERPLVLLNELFGEVMPFEASTDGSSSIERCKAKLVFRIIGPAGSTTLKAMVGEAKNLLRKNDQEQGLPYLARAHIYSPSATASGREWMAFPDKSAIVNFLDGLKSGCSDGAVPEAQTGDRELKADNPRCEFTEAFEPGVDEQHRNIDSLLQRAAGIRFISTIMPDRLLMDKLAAELDKFRTRNLDSAPIALVSEWDTHYARELPKSFVKALKARLDPDRRDSLDKNIYRYSYIRGIDGHLPDATESNGSESDNGSAEAEKDNEFAPKRAKRRRPSGHSQYDYLQRMAAQLERTGAKLSRDYTYLPPGGFVAIGVLGSDVYDKLLIMQALNARFPSAIFFTTDMDANFWHPAEIPHTRNLLIASSYGLELNKYYYQDVGRPPPFRDVYQVSRYLATYLSVDQSSEQLSPEDVLKGQLQPRLFEVGRTGPVDITWGADPNSDCDEQKVHPCADDHPVHARLYPGTAKSLTLAALVVLGLIFLFLYRYFYRARAQLDPHSGYAGVMAALLLLVGVLLLGLISEVFDVQEPFAWFEGVSLWPSYFVRIAAGALALALLGKAWRDVSDCDIKLLRVLNAPHLETGKRKAFEAFLRFTAFSYPDNLDDFGVRYSNYARRNERLRRIIGLLLVYFLFALSLMLTLGYPHVPLRSSQPWIDPLITIGFAVIPMLLLLFFVLDSTKLATWLAQCLSRQETKWPEGALDQYLAADGAGANDGSELAASGEIGYSLQPGGVPLALRDWLSLRVIARHSEVYGNLVHFPAVVILLMMFSRFSYFDDLPYNPSLILVVLIAWSYLIFCAVSLRRSAETARNISLSRLETRLAIARGQGDEVAATVSQLEYAIDNIRALCTGAFRPLTQQPWLRALAYLFGGGGSLILLEYMVWAG